MNVRILMQIDRGLIMKAVTITDLRILLETLNEAMTINGVLVRQAEVYGNKIMHQKALIANNKLAQVQNTIQNYILAEEGELLKGENL